MKHLFLLLAVCMLSSISTFAQGGPGGKSSPTRVYKLVGAELTINYNKSLGTISPGSGTAPMTFAPDPSRKGSFLYTRGQYKSVPVDVVLNGDGVNEATLLIFKVVKGKRESDFFEAWKLQ